MEKNQLIYVIMVAETGSITKAAEKLHLSQPSLSNQIISLERELGISLFERIKKRVYLTDAGQAFVEHARQIVNDFQSLAHIMGEYSQKKLGYIRIGALSIMCPLQIPDLIHQFGRLYPGITVSLLESGSISLLQSLTNNEIDVAFALWEPRYVVDDDITAIRLMDSDIYAVVSHEHPLSGRKELTLTDFSGIPLIVNTVSFKLSSIIISKMEAAGINYVISNQCDQIDSCLSLASKNLGVFFCSKETVSYYPYDNLEVIPVIPPISRGVYLIYKKNPDFHPALQSFIRYTLDFYNQVNSTARTPGNE